MRKDGYDEDGYDEEVEDAEQEDAPGAIGALGHLVEALGHFASEPDGDRRRRPARASRHFAGAAPAPRRATAGSKGCACSGIRLSVSSVRKGGG